MPISKQELIDKLNDYIGTDDEVLTKAVTARIYLDKPSILQSNPISFKEGSETVISLLSALDTLHESGERIRVIIKNGVITRFF